MKDAWGGVEAYERFIGRWSRRVAPAFVEWLAIPAGRSWLDVGCGTGALSQAIRDRGAHVIGVEPSEGFRTDGVLAGSATAIPLSDRAVDVCVSGLVLNFVDDPRAALAEMTRVTREVVAAYVWDYAGEMQMLRYFWDAAGEPALDEGARFPLCTRAAMSALFDEVHAIDIETRFSDFDDYWQPFLGAIGPAPTYVASLDPDARARLRDRVRARLPIAPDGSITMIARAWAGRRATC